MSKIIIFLTLLSFLIFPVITQASVVPIGTAADATLAFDDLSSYISATQQTDSFMMGAQSSQVNNGLLSGNNPISAVMNDPIFINSSLDAENSDVDFEYVRYFFEVNLNNASADSTAEFVFDYRISQQVSASASDPLVDDAFVDSAFALLDDTNQEFLFRTISSELNTGPQTSNDSGTFSFLLNAGESLSFGGYYESNLYSFGEAAFSALTNAELTLSSVNITTNNVSAPGHLALMFMFSSLMLVKRRRA